MRAAINGVSSAIIGLTVGICSYEAGAAWINANVANFEWRILLVLFACSPLSAAVGVLCGRGLWAVMEG